MHKLLAALALAGLVAAAGLADDPKPLKIKQQDPTKKPAESLKVGDSAPALKATSWVQGEEVKAFEAGKVYVVEFWATWCGPCIVMMPHMAELQAEYKDKGVTIIGFSAKDPNNDAGKVAAFVKKRGPKLQYTFAYADDRNTYDAWMRAAGRTGIPCSFVVDKQQKIAYIGHPMFLDVVLPKVVDGTWKGQESVEEIGKIEKEVSNVFGGLRGDPETALKTVKDFETKYPALSKIPYFVRPKLDALLKAKKVNEARKLAEEVMQRAIKQDDPLPLQAVSFVMRSPAAKEEKGLLDLSVKAAEAMVKVSGENDALALFNLAETYLATGDRAKAIELGKKAVEAADTPALKRAIEQRLKGFGDEKKPDA